jgi:hypothetical protein
VGVQATGDCDPLFAALGELSALAGPGDQAALASLP